MYNMDSIIMLFENERKAKNKDVDSQPNIKKEAKKPATVNDDDLFKDVDSKADGEKKNDSDSEPVDSEKTDTSKSDKTSGDTDADDSINEKDLFKDVDMEAKGEAPIEDDEMDGDTSPDSSESENEPSSDDNADSQSPDGDTTDDGEEIENDEGDMEDADMEEETVPASPIAPKSKEKKMSLLSDMLDIHNYYTNMLDKINAITYHDNDITKYLVFISDALIKNKQTIYDYINIRYNKNSYEANLCAYFNFTETREIVEQLLNKISDFKNKI